MTEVNSRLLLSQHSHIDHVVYASNLDSNWSNYKSYLNPAVLLNLAHCAEALSKYDEIKLETEEIDNLSNDIDNLFEKVRDSDINVELKTIMLHLLEGLRRSISEYFIRGAAGIRDHLAYFLGTAFQNSEKFKLHKDTEEVKSFWNIFARADNMTTVAVNAIQLTCNIMKLLS
jgi:hypothetical protein